MTEENNTFVDLIHIYNDQVAEIDAKGFADIFKECTERFFDAFSQEKSHYPRTIDGQQIHFSDIEYLDGYFDDAYGSNSVVHFHIDECPEWKFGIWWSIPENGEHDQVSGEFFAQYEATIDKFKPTASIIRSDIVADKDYCACHEAVSQILFIKNEPHLAFCRDYCCWNYNKEYHSREEADIKYDQFRIMHDNKVRYTKQYDDQVLDFVRQNILPLFCDAEIVDLGNEWAPRYEVRAPLNKNRNAFEKDGFHNWFDDYDESGKEIMRQFKTMIEKFRESASDMDFCWFRPIAPTVYVYKDKDK